VVATIDTRSVLLHITVPGTKPDVTPMLNGVISGFAFNSPTIDADGAMTLKGTAGEDVAGWTLGFI